MKRIMAWGLLIICLTGLVAGCSSENTDQAQAAAMKLDASGYYTGFSGLPVHYTVEQAETDRVMVMQNSEVIAGQELWDQFEETAAQGGDAGIRLVSFFDNEADSPFFADLYYNDGAYYLFDSTAETQEKHPFSYMLSLRGQIGSSQKESGMVVLTNDSSLTLKQVWQSMISSDTAVRSLVAPYRMVRILTE